VPTFKDKGLVLREVETAENSKRLLLLTQGRGRIWAFARGAAGVKSKLKAPKMTFCEFVLYDGGQFLSLAQVAQIRAFPNLVGDFDAYCIANFLLEAVDRMLLPAMPADEALKLILLTFARLDGGCDPWLVFSAGTFKLLQQEGFVPITDNCSGCGDKFPGKYFFAVDGITCQNCGGLAFSDEARLALEYILEAPLAKIFNFKASPDVLMGLKTAALMFFSHHVDVELKSMAFIK